MVLTACMSLPFLVGCPNKLDCRGHRAAARDRRCCPARRWIRRRSSAPWAWPAGDRAEYPAQDLFYFLVLKLFEELEGFDKVDRQFRFHDSPRPRARPRAARVIHLICGIARKPLMLTRCWNSESLAERWRHSRRHTAFPYPHKVHKQGHAAIMARLFIRDRKIPALVTVFD